MLRLTTKVTVSPASRRRSSSAAAAHVLDHRRALLGEQRRQLIRRERSPVARPLDGPRREVIGHVQLGPPAAAPAGDERPVPVADHVEHRLGDPRASRCTPGTRRGARRAATPSGARRLRTCAGDGNGCSGEMWSPLALSPPRSLAPARTSSGHQSDRLGGTWIPTSGIRRRASADQALHVLETHRDWPRPARRAAAPRRPRSASTPRAAAPAIWAGSRP